MMFKKINSNTPGIFLLSLDTELIWGIYYGGYADYYKKHLENWRVNIKRLIALLEQYQIKATWAFVGHLFLDRCEKVNGITHPDVLDLGYSNTYENWRFFDPCSDIQKHPYWYGKDVLELVKSMSPRQEIDSHTFFHTIMDDPACTPEVARSEIKKCMDIAKTEGVKISTIVFPRNRLAHLNVVREFGISAYREAERVFFRNWPHFFRRVFLFFQHLLAITPPLYRLKELQRKEGLLGIPSSLPLLNYNGIIKGRIIPSRVRFLRAKKGIESAIKKRAIFHLYFHPFDLESSEQMIQNLEDILQLARKYIDAGRLVNLTMQETERLYHNLYEKS